MSTLNEVLVVIVRGVIAFFTLLIYARILGKQQISQLTYFDYILGITVGSTASSLTVSLETRAWPQWIGLLTWVGLAIILQFITLKWRFASKFIDGEPTVVVMNGRIMEGALKKMRYRLSDFLEELRVKGLFDLSEVEFAVLETNGQVSVLKKSEFQNVTLKDLHLPSRYKGLSTELIYDGVIFDQNLRQVNLDRAWLEKELTKQGINDPAEVFLASLDTGGNLYVDKYRDRIMKMTEIGDFPGPY